MLNAKKGSGYTPNIFGMQTRGSSKSDTLIFRWVMAFAGSDMHRVTVDSGVGLFCKKLNIICQLLTLCASS